MSKYWKNTYGSCRSRDFIDGVKAGVETFAVWKSGYQYVGVLMVPIDKIFTEIEEQLGGNNDKSG